MAAERRCRERKVEHRVNWAAIAQIDFLNQEMNTWRKKIQAKDWKKRRF